MDFGAQVSEPWCILCCVDLWSYCHARDISSPVVMLLFFGFRA